MRTKSVGELANEWWSVGLRGGLAVVAGVVVVLSPIPHTERLLRVFGLYLVIDGLITLLAAIQAVIQRTSWLRLTINGLLGVVFGYANLAGNGTSPATRADIIAVRTLVVGVSGIILAWQVRGALPDNLPERLLILAGVGSIIFSLIIFVGPTIEAAVLGGLDWLATLYLLVFGLLLLVIAARLRTIAQTPTPAQAT